MKMREEKEVMNGRGKRSKGRKKEKTFLLWNPFARDDVILIF